MTINQGTAEATQAAVEAKEDLADALKAAKIVLPSLAVDSVATVGGRMVLVSLGRARPDVIKELAAVIRKGTKA